MEFYYYILISSLFVYSVVLKQSISKISTLAFFLLPIVVRSSGYDVDIINYEKFMKSEFSSIIHETRYLKEPLFWFSINFLYKIFNNSLLVFLIVDYFLLFIVYLSFRNFKIKPKYLLALVLFFPFFLGFQNIYRQLLAAVIFVYALSLNNGAKRSIFIGGLSVLIHNVFFLFLPILLILNNKNYYRLMFVPFFILIVTILLNTSKGYHANTGLKLEFVYLFLFTVMLIGFFLYKKRLLVNELYGFLIFYLIYLIFMIKFDSLYIERFALAGLMIFFPFIVVFVETKVGKWMREFLRIGFAVFCVLPIFLFSNAFAFIQ